MGDEILKKNVKKERGKKKKTNMSVMSDKVKHNENLTNAQILKKKKYIFLIVAETLDLTFSLS